MIKSNKNFHDDNGNFERIKYEKFLLENNQSAPGFEARLRNRELQKSLFDFVGAGTVSPNFLVKKLYNDENRNLEIEFIDLSVFYKKKSAITDQELEKFVRENKDNLKVEYLDFDYLIINPTNLIGSTYLGGGSDDGYNNIASNYGDEFRGEIMVDKDVIMSDLNNNKVVLTEGIQTVMRKHGIVNAYEKMKELSRGEHDFQVEQVIYSLSDDVKKDLDGLDVTNYVGYSVL